MSLIEQAARALAASHDGSEWDALDLVSRERCRTTVRAVLNALRDPDEEMAAAGAGIIRHVGSAESEMAYQSDAATTWRFMMDALLCQRV